VRAAYRWIKAREQREEKGLFHCEMQSVAGISRRGGV